VCYTTGEVRNAYNILNGKLRFPKRLMGDVLRREGSSKVGVRQYGVKAWTGLNWVQENCSAAHCGWHTKRGIS
jgi:hypothetical protein